jgi:2'-5' RNA ligase
VRDGRCRRTVGVSAPPEGAAHGQSGQAAARGEEAEEEQGQEERAARRDHTSDGWDPAQLRLFAAVRPSVAAAEHLAAALGRDVDPRWHVTLAFLGEQPAADAFDLRPPASRHLPFPLALSGAARLGRSVVATGVRGDTRALAGLARDVQDTCRAAGAVLERRRWRPHLTVSRDGVVPAALWDYEGPAWTVTQVELVHSVLGRAATHEVLRAFRLG